MAGFSLVETHKDGNIKLRFQHSNTGQRHAEAPHRCACVSVFAACDLLGSKRCRLWNLRLTEGQVKKRHLGQGRQSFHERFPAFKDSAKMNMPHLTHKYPVYGRQGKGTEELNPEKEHRL